MGGVTVVDGGMRRRPELLVIHSVHQLNYRNLCRTRAASRSSSCPSLYLLSGLNKVKRKKGGGGRVGNHLGMSEWPMDIDIRLSISKKYR